MSFNLRDTRDTSVVTLSYMYTHNKNSVAISSRRKEDFTPSTLKSTISEQREGTRKYMSPESSPRPRKKHRVNTALISNHHKANSVVAKEIFRGIFHFVNRFPQRFFFPLSIICLSYLGIIEFGPGLGFHIATVDRFRVFKV